MMKGCNRHLLSALALSNKLRDLAEEGEADSEDQGCALLYCIVRDCAYKIRAEAESEMKRHQAVGLWRAAGSEGAVAAKG